MEKKSIMVKKRKFWNTQAAGILIVAFFIYMIILPWVMVGETLKSMPLHVIMYVVFGGLVIGGLWEVYSANRLLQNGILILAKPDMQMSGVYSVREGSSNLYVYCYYEYYGLKIYCACEERIESTLVEKIFTFLEKEGKIPVIVQISGDEKCLVLLKEVIEMLDDKQRECIPKNVIRTIEWPLEHK